ncbi:hypothetical protein [Streptomyces xanthochromogenes]|uniref:Uncharacterized protein n=1 Tax=Streptomyces xanthochromogenes TaxID=67384 RepID=A0ABQ3AZF4_9ACTN|nr:hypothetical protein [Streptomyces xanthochromogenes]GGY71257.1 hypothetical protein GCM10010326_76800 [Streptomyces xanthochromogenes]
MLHAAAALRRDSADLDLYATVLSGNLADSLPPDAVRVERRRSVAQRMAGREGSVAQRDVALQEQRLSLRTDWRRVTCESRLKVRGIVRSRRQAGLDEWIGALAQLAQAAVSNARACEAIERLLVTVANPPIAVMSWR